MSAEHFHHQVEESMKQAKSVYDLMDLESAVGEASPQVVIKSMSPNDFFNWRDFTY